MSKQVSNIDIPSITAPMTNVFARLHDYSVVPERPIAVTIGMVASVVIPPNGMIKVTGMDQFAGFVKTKHGHDFN